jgi:hypothetical protein
MKPIDNNLSPNLRIVNYNHDTGYVWEKNVHDINNNKY